MIEGVRVVPLEMHLDDRGYLVEILRRTDEYFTQFGQVYVSGNLARGVVRAFHKHLRTWDWFFVSHGTGKIALRDDRPESPTYEQMMTIVAGSRKPTLIAIPPGVYHGWMSLEDDSQLISIASEVYDSANPDVVRVPADGFGYDWGIKAR